MKSKFFEKHHGWFSQFSSAFAGTLLGIGITVGINGIIEYRNDKDTAEKFLLKTTEEVDSRYNNLVSQQESMITFSKVFEKMRYVYYDDPSSFTEELSSQFISAILPFDTFVVNDISQQMFSSNIEVLEVFRDLSIVSDISETFSLLTMMEHEIRQIETMRRTLYDRFSKDYDRQDVLTPEEFEKFMDEPEILNIMQLYNLKIAVFPTILEYIKKLNESIKTELGITEEDLQEVRTKRIENVQVDSLETKTDYQGENSSITEEYSISAADHDKTVSK